jgi:hypothetical protein
MPDRPFLIVSEIRRVGIVPIPPLPRVLENPSSPQP